jgi:dihydrofolate synthase/folylpolyglutamate synthase
MPARSLAGWLEYIDGIHPRAIQLGLDRVAKVAERMGRSIPAVLITVAGTNGKGSTCAILEAILRAGGYRVGLYTSPHLLRYNERVRVNGVPVSDLGLCAAFDAVEHARGVITLTYFEFGTLAAWEIFASHPLDVVVLEVGLGGRLDAVNIFDCDCGVLTGVDLDHTDYLGDTREAIGAEKAGIFRSARPAIVADSDPPSSVLRHAEAIGADLRLIGRDFGYRSEGRQWTYWGAGVRRAGLAHPSLRGSRQLANASAALAALDSLRARVPVAMQDIRSGLAQIELAARFQVLPGRPTVVLDVAHNPQAANVLAENLGDMGFFPDTYAVFGMLRDKDIPGVCRALRGMVSAWFLADLPVPRGASAAMLADVLKGSGVEGPVLCYESPRDAYAAARKQANENDRIVIFGSFHTVADVAAGMDIVPPAN